MNWHFVGRIGFTALVFTSFGNDVLAQEPARPRGTPIIFSAPKSDSVSSNLNELRTPATPFRDLEADLKKSFQVFDPNRADKNFRPGGQEFKPPAQELNKKQLKDQLHERAEQMFLSLEPEDEDLFKANAETFDPYKKKPKTSLDRYYDRLDRSRQALTNRTSNNDLFGDKKEKEKDRRDELGFNKQKPINLLDDERNVTSRNLRQMSNSSLSGENLNGGKIKPQGSANYFGNNESYYERTKARNETRLEEFKRLLDGPGAAPRSNLNPPVSAYEAPAPRPVSSSVTPSWSTMNATPKTTPAKTFATTANPVGTPVVPQGVKDFAPLPSLNPPPQTPPPAKPMPVSTFNIPKRRF